MTQHEINLQEWANPENWSSGFIKAYFSKRDNRVFVPKRPWGIGDKQPACYPKISFRGTTVNFGNPRGLVWFHFLHFLILAPFVFFVIFCATQI